MNEFVDYLKTATILVLLIALGISQITIWKYRRLYLEQVALANECIQPVPCVDCEPRR